MKLFSDCSNCVVCACSFGRCLAGHGDDEFERAEQSDLAMLLRAGCYPDRKNGLGRVRQGRQLNAGEKQTVRQALKEWYGVVEA